MPIKLNLDAADRPLVDDIARRAAGMDKQHNGRKARSILEWTMDFAAVHLNGNPLRLADLREADDFNFAHDAFGIARHLDRDDASPTGGQLLDCFSPRFSQRQSEPA